MDLQQKFNKLSIYANNVIFTEIRSGNEFISEKEYLKGEMILFENIDGNGNHAYGFTPEALNNKIPAIVKNKINDKWLSLLEN